MFLPMSFLLMLENISTGSILIFLTPLLLFLGLSFLALIIVFCLLCTLLFTNVFILAYNSIKTFYNYISKKIIDKLLLKITGLK